MENNTRHAPAKLTLTLRMLDKRDDGFNNLEALTVFLPDVADVLSTRDISDGQSRLTVSQADGSPSEVVNGDTNLVNQAWKLYSEHERVVLIDVDLSQVGFDLVKTIPVQAGLGGGSVDAAATLNILNQMCGEPLTITELGWLAEELGSDVPACMYSQALWMRGRGERVDPLDEPDEIAENLHVVVITPTISCSTPAIFTRYEEMGRPVDEGIPSPTSLQSITPTLHNDLALAAYDAFPVLTDFKNEVEQLTNLPFMLAGSGSSLFSVVDSAQAQETLIAITGGIEAGRLRLAMTSSVI